MYYIYKATNLITGKSYIGQTNNPIKRRYVHHSLRAEDDCLFHRAIQKYGKESFEWEILLIVGTKAQANEAEMRLIHEHNTFKPNGYNMTKGGDGGSMWNASPVVCLTLDGKFIKRYDSAGEAERLDGYCNSDVLISCKNPERTCRGKIFMFESEYLKTGPREYKKPKAYNMKKVVQCDMNGNYIAEYSSVKEAAEKTNINRPLISSAITGRILTAGGFIWVYKKDFPVKNVADHVYRKEGIPIYQIDIETGEIVAQYDRIKDAGTALGVNYKGIHKVLDKPTRTAYGYRWESIRQYRGKLTDSERPSDTVERRW